MRSKLIYLLIFPFLLNSCDEESVIREPLTFGTGNLTFVRSLVSSHDECDNLNRQGVNCAQWMEFVDDTTADIFVTDIGNQGRYLLENDTLVVTITIQSDVESPLIFISDSSFSVLTRISDRSNAIWKRQVEGVNPWDL